MRRGPTPVGRITSTGRYDVTDEITPHTWADDVINHSATPGKVMFSLVGASHLAPIRGSNGWR